VLGGGKTNALLFHTRWRLEFYFILFYFIFHSFKRVGRWQDEKKNCLAIAKEKKSRGKKKNCPCIPKDKEGGKHAYFVKRKE
jgi:hypothetical protein